MAQSLMVNYRLYTEVNVWRSVGLKTFVCHCCDKVYEMGSLLWIYIYIAKTLLQGRSSEGQGGRKKGV